MGLGIPRAALRIALKETSTYHVIAKDRGPEKTPRIIFSPGYHLKLVQKSILHGVLDAIPLPSCVHSCCGRSIFSNAAMHVGQEAVAMFDMQDFFPSVPSDRVRQLFLDVAMERRLANMLTLLTTAKGHLQQGLPTSPAIANIVAIPLDNELLSWCSFRGLNYSRYVDDITISGNAPAMSDVDSIVREAVERNGFVYSDRKFRFMAANAPQQVTGIIVNSCLEVPPEYERAVIEEIDAFAQSESTLPSEVLLEDHRRIVGRIEFCRQVAPATGLALRAHLEEQIRALPPTRRALVPAYPRKRRRKRHSAAGSGMGQTPRQPIAARPGV